MDWSKLGFVLSTTADILLDIGYWILDIGSINYLQNRNGKDYFGVVNNNKMIMKSLLKVLEWNRT